jgi:hypothetical protein
VNAVARDARAQPEQSSTRPGRVVGIDGIVLQCDADDTVSGLFVRPIQELSLRLRGRARRGPGMGVALANHAGIRIKIEGPDGRVHAYVVEQLNGTLVNYVSNALSWTPWRLFKLREGRGGWDVTVPPTAFEGVEQPDVWAAIDALNRETGQPFYREFCTSFIERIFGGRHLFPGPTDPRASGAVLQAERSPVGPCTLPAARRQPGLGARRGRDRQDCTGSRSGWQGDPRGLAAARRAEARTSTRALLGGCASQPRVGNAVRNLAWAGAP